MSSQKPAGAPAQLPELSAQRIDEIEDALFARIATERSREQVRSARRGRVWLAGGAAAAVVAIAAIIAPTIVPLVSPGAGSSGSAIEPGVAPDAPVESSGDSGAATTESGPVDGDESAGTTFGDRGSGERDIVSSATATVVVDDVEAAARMISDSASTHDGYVESMSVGTSGPLPIDGADGAVYDTLPYPYPSPSDGGWITVRVPAAELSAMIDELGGVGEVTASAVDRQDVTEQTVDLRARIDAAQASVDRLSDLMAQATTVADLLAAESALAERQALLESYQQQLEMVEGQIEMSSLRVTLLPVPSAVEADPAGFTDGLAAGWNGLVATLNGIVVALGFLLPWLAVAGVIALVLWAVIRAAGRRRSKPADGSSGGQHDDEPA